MTTKWLKKTLRTIPVLALATAAVAQNASDTAWWQEAAQPYQGVTIRGISESTPPSRYVSDVLAPAFTEATGINVEFEITSWDQMYDKAIKDMQGQHRHLRFRVRRARYRLLVSGAGFSG